MIKEIRILSLWQLWASFILFNLKRYETRLCPTKYRGREVIQASKRSLRMIRDGMVLAAIEKQLEITAQIEKQLQPVGGEQ